MTDPSEYFTPDPQPRSRGHNAAPAVDRPPRHSRRPRKRFSLTPEAVGVLTDRGYEVRIESGASATIHYADTDYMRQGGVCDIARRIPSGRHSDNPRDTDSARPASHEARRDVAHHAVERDSGSDTVRELMKRNIVAPRHRPHRRPRRPHPVCRHSQQRIDGRAAIAIASSMLASPAHGKGILLGGWPA